MIRQDLDMAKCSYVHGLQDVSLCGWWVHACVSVCVWPHDICVICVGQDIHRVPVVCVHVQSSVSHMSTCVHMHVCALETTTLE